MKLPGSHPGQPSPAANTQEQVQIVFFWTSGAFHKASVRMSQGAGVCTVIESP
jgi:hypothetical protein